MTKTPLTKLLIFIVLSPSLLPLVRANAVNVLEWEVSSRNNFSSQIRSHRNAIVLVTLPWLGESRFLMKEIAEKVASNIEEYGSPRLMLLYRNKERMLAEAIGATEGITIIFYRYSLPYKYQGRLRTQNILLSLQYLISHPSEQLPIQPLNTRDELEKFLQSTDKALLLFEFCGWTQQLLANGKKNGTVNDLDSQFRPGVSGESNESLPSHWKKYQASENEKMTCEAQDGFSGIPWLRELSSVSESDSSKSFIHGVSCSSEKFQLFDASFTKFMEVAKEFFLPPERLRFGLVGDKSLLSTLGDEDASSWLSSLNVVDSDSWLVALHFSGCPTCSIILHEGDDLKRALRIQNPLVRELGDGGHDTDPTLPADKPSIILFIDRSSDSLDVRMKSKEAFDAFRSLAFQHHKDNGVDSQFGTKTESLLEIHPQSKRILKSKLSSTSRKVVLKDKVSITVINEGKHVTLDKIASGSQANSLQEILAYVLQGGNRVKLSSLAKEAGFQLLSEDFDVKVHESLSRQTDVHESDQSEKIVTEANINLPKNEIPNALPEADFDLQKNEIPNILPDANTDLQKNEMPNVGDCSPLQNDEQHETSYPHHTKFDTSMQPSGNPIDLHDNQASESTKDEVEFDEKLQSENFTGGFFFSDGGYQILSALTGGLKIPSVIIVDPIQQKHYVLNEERDFSFSSLADFVNEFVNGSLIPFQKSESGVKTSTQAPSPPFVNLDFRAKDFIPQLTSDTFHELVIGFNQTDNLAWKKDVVVFFSNSWCGFCQRMELVVREVYRVFKHYATMQNADSFVDLKSRFPQFYSIDCTLNECSLILRSVAQREMYPYLLLFPAESKAAVSYEGDPTVSDITKFVVHNGNKVRDLVKEKETLWAGVEREKTRVGLQKDALDMSEFEEAPFERDNKHHEVLFEYQIPEKVDRYNKLETHNPILGDASQVVVGSLLIATDQLLNVHVFDHSLILIVSASKDTGFHGLIINKHISWDSLEKLEDGLELLKSARLTFGGPLLQQEMPLVALTRIKMVNYSRQILQNVHFLNQDATRHKIEGIKLGNYSVSDFWFFLGFSSWGWDQLINEINQGAWDVHVAEYDHLDCPW